MKKGIIASTKNSNSLILAGGGMRLAFHAGVLIALEQAGMKFDHVDGTSGGIFATAMLASGLPPKQIADRWRKVTIRHFTSSRPFKKYFKPMQMMGYTDADGIRKQVFPQLGIDLKKINSARSGRFTFNVCNFSDKTIESIPHKSVTEDHLIAGMSLPIVMPAINIGGDWVSDAVWIKDANLVEAAKSGARDLWLIWAIGNNHDYLPGALNQYVHMIEMSANGGLLEEFSQIKLMQANLKKSTKKTESQSDIRLFVIKPTFPLPLDPDLYLNKIDARTLINMGYDAAKNALKSMPEEGMPMDKEVTKMAWPGWRLNISNTFEGTVSNGSTRLLVRYHQYLVFHRMNKNFKLCIFTSIEIDDEGEWPCSFHKISTHSKPKFKELRVSSECIVEDAKIKIHSIQKFDSALESIIGLGFKSVKLTMDGYKNEKPLKGILYQSTKHRLYSLYKNNVRRDDGLSGGLKDKYKLFTQFANYAI